MSVPDFDYHGKAEARAEAGRDGLVSVGDVGYLDEDGYLFLCDRKRDMVISGGVNIYPAEIENALIGMDGVRDCAVFGVPDDEFGERLFACIEPEAECCAVTGRGAGISARTPRQLQGAKGHPVHGRDAARSHRQDLQAQAARSVYRGQAARDGVKAALRSVIPRRVADANPESRGSQVRNCAP